MPITFDKVISGLWDELNRHIGFGGELIRDAADRLATIEGKPPANLSAQEVWIAKLKHDHDQQTGRLWLSDLKRDYYSPFGPIDPARLDEQITDLTTDLYYLLELKEKYGQEGAAHVA